MSDDFGTPASATGIVWADLKGSLILFKVKGFEPAIKTVHGDSPAVQADVVVLDGDQAGAEYVDTLVFPKVLQSQIKPRMGGMVLGRLGQGTPKPGQSAPWMLSEATEADKAAAREYIAKSTEAPF